MIVIMRRYLIALLLPLAQLTAAENKPSPVTIRLHAEGKTTDSETFVVPITLTNPPKKTVIRKVPVVTERDIDAFFPFAAPDGTIGCYFRLDANGSNKLMQHTVEFRDTLAVAMINGRPACVLMVGEKITDGILAIPSGFSSEEVVLLQTKFPIISKEKEFEAQKKKAQDALKELHKQRRKQVSEPKS